MFQRNVGILLGNFDHYFAPELRALKHVRLINRGHLLAPLPRHLEGDMGNALDLCHRVHHGVEAGPRSTFIGESARLAEIHSTQQLAHE